jgi:hypothetical protein
MFLCTLYLGWAFFVLVFMLFEKIFEKLPLKARALKYTVYSVVLLGMAIINTYGLIDIIKFGIAYYPAK